MTSRDTLNDCISTSNGKANKNGVQPIVDLMLILYAHNVYISYECQFLCFFLIIFHKILIIIMLVSSTYPLNYG